MIGRYKNSPVPLEEIRGTVGTMLLERAIEWHDHPVFATRDESGYRHISWHTFLTDIVSIVNLLHSKGVRKGDRVAVLHQGRLIVDDMPEAVRRNSEVREVYFGNI